jgi:hypothetical protein
MKRRRLPRYGTTPTGLSDWRTHVARVSGLPDGHLARYWRTTPKAVRAARIGATFRHVPTPPDRAPRAHLGNWGKL